MAYAVHIERKNGLSISLEEWTSVVENSDHVRMSGKQSITITNPVSGAQISSDHRPGLAEIFDQKSREWHLAFSWVEGRITTRPADDFQSANSQQRSVMRVLSGLLDAEIVGDEGETYE